MTGEELEEKVQDALLNADTYTGGSPGLADGQVLTVMEVRGLIGSRGGLTRKGAQEARRLQAERWGT
jgi:hypothetical protein